MIPTLSLQLDTATRFLLSSVFLLSITFVRGQAIKNKKTNVVVVGAPTTAPSHASKFSEEKHIAEKLARTAEIVKRATAKLEGKTMEDDDPPMEIKSIDMAILANKPSSSKEYQQEIDKLKHSVFTTGFFLIRNVPGFQFEKVNRMKQLVMEMNRLPKETLTKIQSKSHEYVRGIVSFRPGATFYAIGNKDENKYGENQWPPFPEQTKTEEFKKLAMEYYDMMQNAEFILYRALARVLGFPEDRSDVLIEAVGSHRGLLAFNYGANNNNRFRYRNHPHTDWGTITILYPSPGLEVIPKDVEEFQAVNIKESETGTYVVNIGDSLERYTGGKLVSSIHSVRRWEDSERVSIPYFGGQCLDLKNDCKIQALLPKGVKPEIDYPPISHREFIANHWMHFRKERELALNATKAKVDD